jgi:NADPH:quinone reductase-like Zn-dependent oxidoreductase
VLKVQEHPKPELRPGDVLIRAVATSVNPVDWKMRRGYQRVIIPRRPPMILGMDVSGVVEAVGDKATGFAVGDEVYSSPSHKRQGTYAGYVAVDASEVTHKPRNLSHQEAASLPLVGLTAWEALVNVAQLRSGERVMIEAGAGGVGSFALQLAAHLGAEVATTCSPRNEALVRELGAQTVINYREQSFDEVLPPQDVVFEMMGQESQRRALKVLKPGGRLMSINAGLEPRIEARGPLLGTLATGTHMGCAWVGARMKHRVKLAHVVRPPSGQDLARITALVEQGAIKPLVDKVYPLEEIAQAHRYSESGHARGKIVVDLSQAW